MRESYLKKVALFRNLFKPHWLLIAIIFYSVSIAVGNFVFLKPQVDNYKELEKAFVADLHPLDLKNSTAKYINQILKPVHEYFEKHSENLKKIREVGIIK